jgi:hypothetical protein
MVTGVAPQEEDPVQARPGSPILMGHVAQPAWVEACTQRPQRDSGAKGAVDALFPGTVSSDLNEVPSLSGFDAAAPREPTAAFEDGAGRYSASELHDADSVVSRLYALSSETGVPVHEALHTASPCGMVQVYSRQRRHMLQNKAECSSLVRSFVAELTKLVGSLLSRPIQKRWVKQLSADFMPRRSTRLAKNRTRAPSIAVKQTQQNLMVKLGLKSEQVALGPDALEEYSRLFTKPMSQSHVAALAALFGWQVPVSDQAPKEVEALVGLLSLEA